MSFLKRKKIPDELPDLITERLEDLRKSEEKREEIKEERGLKDNFSDENVKKSVNKPSSGEIKEKIEDVGSERIKIDDKKSFFTKLLNDINTELNEGKNIEEWYKNKFLPKDIVNEMKFYWVDNKKELVLKSLGKGFKEKIESKIEYLKNMESEWQNIYFELIKKEEDIKKGEDELKKIISEFVEMCNRRLDKENGSNDEK